MKLQMERKGKHIIQLLLLVLLLVIPVGIVQAVESGSVEVRFGENASQVEMTLYSVAAYEEGSFVFHGVFEDCGISLEDLKDAEEAEHAAQQLAVIAEEKNAEGISKPVDGSGLLRYENLIPGYYLLVQTGGLEYLNVQMILAPVPHTLEDGTLSYEVSVVPKSSVPDGAVILSKTDEEGIAVEQAIFRLEKKEYVSEEGELPEGTETGQDVGGRYFWKLIREDLATNDYGELAVMNLPLGMYRFIETSAPDGYVMNPAPNYVSVECAGQVQEVDGIYEVESGDAAELLVINEQTLVYVNKVDENGTPVSGAKLVVKSKDGKAIVDDEDEPLYAFTSSQEPYELKNLPAGEYLLSELAAPEGFGIAADVPFTVDDTYGAVNEVTMTDPKEKPTDASLSVTKNLEDEHGYAIASKEAVFYVALLADADYTRRVSDVREIRFRGTSSASVTFENLETGKTYYVLETDRYGELLEGIPYVGGVFAPEYPDGHQVTLTPQKPDQEFVFKNVFYSLPEDYYYSGEIAIRKEVLRDGQPYQTNGVFYAGIFTDEACTQRYGDLITLSMNGESEVTVVVPVSIGKLPEGVMTYYIAETDSSGKVLDDSSDINFTVSVDKSSVTLDVEKRADEVTITNSYDKEEEYESEFQSPGTSGGGSVQTGDESPVELMTILMLMAAAVMVVLRKVKRC